MLIAIWPFGSALINQLTRSVQPVESMKYYLFTLILIVGVPAMVIAAYSSVTLKGLLIALLIFSTALGDMANINFISMELYRGPDRGFEINLTDLILLSLFISFLIQYPMRLKWLPVHTGLMLGLFVLACISISAANQPLLSLFTLFKMLKFYLLYWCMTNYIALDSDPRFILAGLVASGLFVAMLAFQQKYLLGIYRIHGPFDHSNTIPLYLNLMIPLVLGWTLTAPWLKSWQVIINILAVLGMMFAVVATFSRAGTGLMAVSVITTLIITSIYTRTLRIKIVALVFCLCSFVGVVVAADSIIERFNNAPETSADARHEFNVVAEMMAIDNTFGVGLNNFSRALTETPEYRDHLEVMKHEEQGGVVHHIYWLTAAELGYPGLFLFVLLLLRIAWKTFRLIPHLETEYKMIAWGTLIGFCCLHTSGFVEWAFRITPVFYMFAITSAIAMGIYTHSLSTRTCEG